MRNVIVSIVQYILSRYICIKTNSKIYGWCKLNFKTILEGHNVINKKVSISNSTIGYGTYIGENSKLENCSIGRYCSIAENVKVVVGRHPTKTFVSTHPAFFSTQKQAGFTYVNKMIFNERNYVNDNEKKVVGIGNDVWLGANVTILEGSIIGDGVIVGAGALVLDNLEPYCIYGGVPAKKIGERFTHEEKNFLLSFKWWDRETQWIADNAALFSDIKMFMASFLLNRGENAPNE